jgi:DNA-binding IclR family transcriptional regulator
VGRESSQTLDRGLRLLELLAESDEPLSVTALATGLGTARPVVYRLLTTLESHGLARADGAGRYRLGLGGLRFTERSLPLLRATAEPHLRSLAERVAATAHLTLADGGEGVAVVVVEPASTTFHVAYRTGTRHPLSLGAAGKAILGGRAARPRRWYVTRGELQEGATGLAVPLGHPDLEASVGVVSFGGLDTRAVGPVVVSAADLLRADLGGRPAA